MRLKDKIFTIHNDQPFLNPIGINIKEFGALWEADKTEEKIEYAKHLAYIYHMWEYDSPYYDRRDKEAEIVRDFLGKKTWTPPKYVKDALARYMQLDDSAEKRALDAGVAACDSIAMDLAGLRQKTDNLEQILKELEAKIKSSTNVEEKVKFMKIILDLQEQKMSISKMIMDMMPKLEKTVETVLNLRKKVTKSVYKGESSDSTIGEFLYDKLMNELLYEQGQDEE